MLSEVARIRQQIEAELLAMVGGLSGYAEGIARHQFIHLRMHRVDAYHDQLALLVGEDQAAAISFDVYRQVVREEESYDPQSTETDTSPTLPGTWD